MQQETSTFQFFNSAIVFLSQIDTMKLELLLVLSVSLVKSFNIYLPPGVIAFNSSYVILPQQISACVLPVIHGFLSLKTITHSNRILQRKRVRFGLKENDQFVILDIPSSCNFQAHLYTVVEHITTFLVIIT